MSNVRRGSVTISIIVLTMLAAWAQAGVGQAQDTGPSESTPSFVSLPRAPLPATSVDPSPSAADPRVLSAPKYASTIEAHYRALRLIVAGKFAVAGSELFSLEFPVGAIAATGLSHGLAPDPKYGTNSEGFVKRVGAAGARDSSQIVFSHAILAPLLHQDPRYYLMGPDHRVFARVAYAATRVLIGKTDGGHRTINFAELLGYGGSAALTRRASCNLLRTSFQHFNLKVRLSFELPEADITKA